MRSPLRHDSRFLLDDFRPAYLGLSRPALAAKVEAALRELEDCRACPRSCGVNRMKGETRVCNTGRHAIVSSAFAHRGEEDCLRGTGGSGTIFFSLCNLEIDRRPEDRELDAAFEAARRAGLWRFDER